jgi:hypothetical protein
MAELGIEQAASAYGVTPDAIWRAIQDGQLPARIDGLGKYLVIVPPLFPPSPGATPAPPAGGASSRRTRHPWLEPAGSQSAPADSLARELEYTRHLLAEVSRQRDQLEAQVHAQLRQLERSEEAQHELRVLIGSALRPGDGSMRQVPASGSRRRWWPF